MRKYLHLYLYRLEANTSIQDINFNTDPNGTFQPVLAVSDDSYVGTIVAGRALPAFQLELGVVRR